MFGIIVEFFSFILGLFQSENEEQNYDEIYFRVEENTKTKPIEWHRFWDFWNRRDAVTRAARQVNGAPSMWKYDGSRLPGEFIGLNQESFLVDPSQPNLCVLEKHIFIKLCSMLSPREFLNLSQTCRFLHWRMYSFCTCYVKTTVKGTMVDDKTRDFSDGHILYSIDDKPLMLRFPVILGAEGGYELTAPCPSDDVNFVYFWQRLQGFRGFFVYRPLCLRNPFFFETLELKLKLPLFEKTSLARCLPFIRNLRKLARRLNLTLDCDWPHSQLRHCVDYPAINDFLSAVSATTVHFWIRDPTNGRREVKRLDEHLYVNCPYVQSMDEVSLYFSGKVPEVFLNRIGNYEDPPISAIQRTMEEFFYGQKNLEFHCYEDLIGNGVRLAPLVSDLFERYNFDEEYRVVGDLSEQEEMDYGDESRVCGHVWYATVTTEETGRRHRLKIAKYYHYNDEMILISIGKEATFSKHQKCYYDTGTWWRMETAVEQKD